MPKTTGHAKTIAGKPVLNAKRRVTLHISPADTKAQKKNPGACAAAMAAVRGLPNCVAARVHLGRTYLLREDGKWYRYKTTDALRNEIIAFDRGGQFMPGEYELRPLSPADMLPKRKKNFVSSNTNRSTPGNHPSKTPRKLHVVKGVRKSQAKSGAVA